MRSAAGTHDRHKEGGARGKECGVRDCRWSLLHQDLQVLRTEDKLYLMCLFHARLQASELWDRSSGDFYSYLQFEMFLLVYLLMKQMDRVCSRQKESLCSEIW